MNKVKVILIGASTRGIIYTDIMANHPDKFQVVAVADPSKTRRDYIKETHGISDDMCFDDYKPLLALGKIADVAVIATQDRLHFEPAMMAISLKYDLLLEKPIAPTPEECVQIARKANEMGSKVIICHVLRFTPFFNTLKDIIDSGKIGRIINIDHVEGVGNDHYAHSFVRGNWSNSKVSSPMLLQKSCHDIDILQWLIGKQCKRVSSVGMLTYFKEENAPKGSAERCMDCKYQDTCGYSAKKKYLESDDNTWIRPACTNTVNPSDEEVLHALNTTTWGKCVFRCDNDVVDHQVVTMEFEDDILCSFTMSGFAGMERHLFIMGTEGDIKTTATSDKIAVHNHITNQTEYISLPDDAQESAHGGGDIGIVDALYEVVNGTYKGKSVCSIEQSKDNHMIVFAAEKAREQAVWIDMDEYLKSFN